MNNNSKNAYIGIDVSKAHLDIHIRPIAKQMKIENSQRGMKRLLRFLKQTEYSVQQIVCESSGGYQRLAVRILEEEGYNVWSANPALVKSFIRSEGVLSKTDAHDAKMIALFAEKKEQSYEKEPWSQEMEDLQELVKRKADLVQMLAMEKTRLQSPTVNKACSRLIKGHIRQLEKQIKKVDTITDEQRLLNPVWKKKTEIMQSIPGIGRETAVNLLTFMPELGKITGKQSAALLGVAPYANESGCYRGKTSVRGGRSIPRRLVYMAALSASRANPVLKQFYNRLRTKGKKPKVAIVAVMRKLITFINVLLEKEKLWDSNHYKIA